MEKAAWADANRAEEPAEKSKAASPRLGAGSTFPRDAASHSSIGGKQRRLSWQETGPGEAGVRAQDTGRLADRAAGCLAFCCAGLSCRVGSGCVEKRLLGFIPACFIPVCSTL